MNTLKAGFSSVNITPMMGVGIAGCFVKRNAERVLDELEIQALALEAYDEGGYEARSSDFRNGIVSWLLKRVRRYWRSCAELKEGIRCLPLKMQHW